MIDFLEKHFRYDTMSSWNGSSAWANNMKIYKVIPPQFQDKIFEMLDCDEFYDGIHDLIRDYGLKNNYRYQAGFNGRSGGYLVIYNGGLETKTIFQFSEKETDPHFGRDYADGYGWMSKEEAIKLGLYKKEIKKIFTLSGRSVDDVDYSELEVSELKEMV